MKMYNTIFVVAVSVLLVSCSLDNSRDYTLSPQETLQVVLKDQDIVSPEELADVVLMGAGNYQLIDLRTPHEFLVEHARGAVNLPAKNLLKEENLSLLNQGGKTPLLYGNNSEQVYSYYILLKQLGVKNIKIAFGGYDFIKDNILDSYGIRSGSYYSERARYDYAKVVSEIAGSGAAPATSSAPKAKKKIIKRKKKEVEGGCG